MMEPKNKSQTPALPSFPPRCCGEDEDSSSSSNEEKMVEPLELTPCLSFESDSDSDSSSCCAKGSPPVSSSALGKLQRSTLDLSNLDSNGGTMSSSSSSRSSNHPPLTMLLSSSSSSRLSELSTCCRGRISSNNNAATAGNSKPSAEDMKNLSNHSRFGSSDSMSSSTLMMMMMKKKKKPVEDEKNKKERTSREGESGIAAFFEGTFTSCRLSLHRAADEFERNLRIVFASVEAALRNVFGMILSTLFPINNSIHQLVLLLSREPTFAKNQDCQDSSSLPPDEALIQQEFYYDELQPDDLLSPTKVTDAPSSNTKDEWGHFADFQEDLADEATTATAFICKSESFLTTLEEAEEDIEDEDGEFF